MNVWLGRNGLPHVNKICEIIKQALWCKFSISTLSNVNEASLRPMNQARLYHWFKKQLGTSVNIYLRLLSIYSLTFVNQIYVFNLIIVYSCATWIYWYGMCMKIVYYVLKCFSVGTTTLPLNRSESHSLELTPIILRKMVRQQIAEILDLYIPVVMRVWYGWLCNVYGTDLYLADKNGQNLN